MSQDVLEEYKKNLMVKSTILTMLLIENLDELEEHGLFRKNLKKSGKPFKHQLLVYINKVFDVAEEKSLATDYMSKVSKKIDEFLKEI